ncbi:MAG: aminomethyl-transferring glycine dehydrogenase subunit GcvPA [Thermoprotei archaeon]
MVPERPRNPYVPLTENDVKTMLEQVKASSIDELFKDVPVEPHSPNLPAAVDEATLERELSEKLGSPPPSYIPSRYVPALLDEISSRAELYTAYTSYQSELSQGMLQSLFEFQSLVSELTGMDAVTSSLYDGGAALGEAALLSKRVNGRKKLLVASSADPQRKAVLKTYAYGGSLDVVEIPFDESGEVDLSLGDVTDEVSMVYVESPNFFGVIEEGLDEISAWAHSKGAIFGIGVDLPSLSVLKPPSDYGADVVVAEGVGSHPYASSGLGILAARGELTRQLPGKLVGATLDSEGKLAYCLTLLTREQSIRREKATSNVTTDSALNAVRAAAYISLMGAEGMAKSLKESAKQSHELALALASMGYEAPTFSGPYLDRFVARLPGSSGKPVHRVGIPLWKHYPLQDQVLLFGGTPLSAIQEIMG